MRLLVDKEQKNMFAIIRGRLYSEPIPSDLADVDIDFQWVESPDEEGYCYNASDIDAADELLIEMRLERSAFR